MGRMALNLEYPRNTDPFAEADPQKLVQYRAWAHRALDTIIDYRLTWEAEGRNRTQPYHSWQSDYVESDAGASELYETALMFAVKLIGRKAHAFNAEMFDESDPSEMRAALRKLIYKMSIVWPSRPTPVSDFAVRRSIQFGDLVNALIDLDKGHTPDLCEPGHGKNLGVMKERCRFAGALWSIHLKERGVSNYTAKVVSAFGLGQDGAKTVQRWKQNLERPDQYISKLGYHHESHVTSLIARAKMVHTRHGIEGFSSHLVFNVFGHLRPSLETLENIGALYRALSVTSA